MLLTAGKCLCAGGHDAAVEWTAVAAHIAAAAA